MNLSKLQEPVKDRGAWSSAVRGITKSWHQSATEQQQHKKATYTNFLGNDNSKVILHKVKSELCFSHCDFKLF